MQAVFVDWTTGALCGAAVEKKEKRAAEMRGLFRDAAALDALAPDHVIYRVQFVRPVADGGAGGLFWGNTTVEPGLVGDEYFMTQGHFHALRDRAEYYATVHGEGALILMDENRSMRMEPMRAGSLHYIPGGLAHRVANTGNQPLTFLACWPSDAGHDYDSIIRNGFGARLRCVGGYPTLVGVEPE